MKNHKVYLAGPIKGLNYDSATGWRDYVKEELERAAIYAYSPMRAKSYLQADKSIDSSDSNYSEYPMSVPPAVVCRDRFDATTCDVLFVNLLGAKAVSIGTVFEIAWADANRIPIVLVIEKQGNPHEHMFIRYICNFQVDNLKEGVHIVKSILIPS